MVVLDASVITKWFKPDERSPRADSYFQEDIAGRNAVFVPTLLVYELTNALLVSKRLKREEIEQALSALEAARLNFINPDTALLFDTLGICQTQALSFYDASYAALARRLDCTFVTADKKLYQNAKSLIAAVLL